MKSSGKLLDTTIAVLWPSKYFCSISIWSICVFTCYWGFYLVGFEFFIELKRENFVEIRIMWLGYAIGALALLLIVATPPFATTMVVTHFPALSVCGPVPIMCYFAINCFWISRVRIWTLLFVSELSYFTEYCILV